MRTEKFTEAMETMALESKNGDSEKEDKMRKQENEELEAMTAETTEETQETQETQEVTPVVRDYLILFANCMQGWGTYEEAREYCDRYLSGGPERSARISREDYDWGFVYDGYYRQWFGRKATSEERKSDIIDFGEKGHYGPWTRSVTDKYVIAPKLSDLTGRDSGIVMRFDGGSPQFGEFVNWQGEYGLPSILGGSEFSLDVFHLISERVISEAEVRELVKAYDQRGLDCGMIMEELLPKFDEKMQEGSKEFDFSQGAMLYTLSVTPEFGIEDDFTQVIVPRS